MGGTDSLKITHAFEDHALLSAARFARVRITLHRVVVRPPLGGVRRGGSCDAKKPKAKRTKAAQAFGIRLDLSQPHGIGFDTGFDGVAKPGRDGCPPRARSYPRAWR